MTRDEKIALAREELEAGKSIARVSPVCGMSERSMRAMIKDGILPPAKARESNMKTMVYSAEKIAEAQKLADEGMSVARIAAHIGITDYIVRKMAREGKITVKGFKRKPRAEDSYRVDSITGEQILEAKRLLKEANSAERTASLIGVSQTIIYQYIHNGYLPKPINPRSKGRPYKEDRRMLESGRWNVMKSD